MVRNTYLTLKLRHFVLDKPHMLSCYLWKTARCLLKESQEDTVSTCFVAVRSPTSLYLLGVTPNIHTAILRSVKYGIKA